MIYTLSTDNYLKLIIEDTAIDNFVHAKCQKQWDDNIDYAKNEAIEYLNKATKLEPQNSNIYFALGNIYFYKKQYNLSEKYYNKAINITPLAHYKYKESYIYTHKIIKLQ